MPLHIGHFGVPVHLHLGVFQQPGLIGLVRPQFTAAVDQVHLAGKLGEEHRLLHSGVAAAHHGHFLAAEEEAIAGGTGRNAETAELRLIGQAQPARLGAGGDHDCIGGPALAAVRFQHKRALRHINPGHDISDDLGADMAGLGFHLHHQIGAHHHGFARPILHFGGDGQLAARLQALDQHRVQQGARGIDGSGIAGRTRTDNQNLGMTGHESESPERAAAR